MKNKGLVKQCGKVHMSYFNNTNLVHLRTIKVVLAR
jgi:hypothetical protein